MTVLKTLDGVASKYVSGAFMERVELHCHSKYSEMDGLDIHMIYQIGTEEGMPAVASLTMGAY